MYRIDSGGLPLDKEYMIGREERKCCQAVWNLYLTINLSESAKTTIPLGLEVEPTPLQCTFFVHI
jgi:hypothetical protein